MENLNSVCFISKVNKIEPIEGADKIELVTVDGWTSVTTKGQHKINDLVICVTTDAVIPEELATKWNVINYLRNKSRVRTVKLRGVYSECILMPNTKLFKEGKDLMNELGIFKYEPPVKNIQLASGKTIKYRENPQFQIYYKFPNQKNVPNMFNETNDVVITRKVHGTNARYGIVKKSKLSFIDMIKKLFGNKWIGYEYVYGSHNVEKGSDSQGFYSTDVWSDINKKYEVKEKLWNYVKSNFDPSHFGLGLVIYGEIFGEGIQKNYDYGYKEHKLELFDIQLDGKYLSDNHFQILNGEIGICDTVEYLYTGKWSKEIQDKLVFNNFIDGTKIPHEGVVVKDISGERQRISKVINPDYLTYGEKHGTTDSH